MELLFPILLIFAVSFAAPTIVRRLSHAAGWILAAFPLFSFFYFLYLSIDVGYGIDIYEKINWADAIGVHLSFYLDGLSLLFLLLVTGIGSLVLVYSGYYMQKYELKDRFYMYLMFFMAAMMGLVLSGNLITIFLFWELTSVSSFLLIGFFHEKDASRSSALQALLVTVMGGLALLAGFVIINQITGSFELVDLLTKREVLQSSPHYFIVLVLVFAGAFTKSAQFPFHFWLPNAMAGPSPVSAFLHSATMVKAGVYLVMRLAPVLGGTPEWQTGLMLFGVTTMLIGSYLALTQTDLKKILAYTTISALGTLMMLVGIDTPDSIKAAVIFLVVHSLYKGSLFMLAGSIDKKTGTRDINLLGGLSKTMPYTTVAALVALFSMAGLPPFIGFIGKELIYEAKVSMPGATNIVLYMGVLSNVFMVAVSGIFAWRVFFGRPGNTPLKPQETPFRLWLGPGVLAIFSLLLALTPTFFATKIAGPAISAILAEEMIIKLSMWHGFNMVLLLSAVTVALGVLIFAYRNKVIPILQKINKHLIIFYFANEFSKLIDGFLYFTKKKTGIVQSGFLRIYLMVIFIATSAFVWYQLINLKFWSLSYNFNTISPYILGIVILMTAATFFAVITKSRITAIISLGVVGWGIALIFAYFGAVDLAITQIMVETLIVVLFVMVIYHLPVFKNLSDRPSRIRDGIIAVLFGSFMTVITLKADIIDLHPAISDYYNQNSLSQAFGKNVVNVILVDFRALDTLGEITVLVIAAIGVFSLFRQKITKSKIRNAR
jgi:multicomponent Na+:H+ antiporter subunit A